MPKQNGQSLLWKGQKCPLQFSKSPSGALKIAVKKKTSLSKKKTSTSVFQSCDNQSENSNKPFGRSSSSTWQPIPLQCPHSSCQPRQSAPWTMCHIPPTCCFVPREPNLFLVQQFGPCCISACISHNIPGRTGVENIKQPLVSRFSCFGQK